jgi:hypothetical protein
MDSIIASIFPRVAISVLVGLLALLYPLVLVSDFYRTQDWRVRVAFTALS